MLKIVKFHNNKVHINWAEISIVNGHNIKYQDKDVYCHYLMEIQELIKSQG